MTALYDPDRAITDLVEQLATLLPARDQRLATAESCTGGLIAAACTDVAGSSAWFERGYVTYSNEAKQADLGVPAAMLADHGAVSEPVVAAMTRGALAASPMADWAVAVSGVAGPGGGSEIKPVGTVYIGWQARGAESVVVRYHFDGDRSGIRRAAVLAALVGLRERVDVS
ncbi:CinA family protein [Salinisphaera sp.]|uniref:CinA family protein n=1 Tax=Salinisphaera sp. TaxID=1914330 RepID=UPI002D79C977|nr:CinA family protein [Salinisphaera sp.]HET7313059.1 CinA family protein [Salinisphaera sp.]